MTLPREDELEVLEHDYRKAVRDADSLARAPFEGRWCGTVEGHERAVHFAAQKVRDLRAELLAARAELETADEAA